MKTLFTIFKIVFIVLLTGASTVSAQDFFRVIGGIPHLPVVDTLSIASPVSGMLIYSNSANQPLIYNGSTWVTLCSDNIDTALGKEYLEVETGIPFLPSLNADPVGTIDAGAIYLSKTQNTIMIYNGNTWGSVANIVGNGNFSQYNGFSTNSDLKISKLPVLNGNPNPLGLSMGAIYINSVSKTICYYDGTVWRNIDCLPVISAIVPTAITNTSALSGVNIKNNGGSAVTLQGICWSTNANPDITLSTKTSNQVFGTDIGLFPSIISGLMANTLYYVRAYAVNASGIAYSQELTFTTASAAVPSIITTPINVVSLINANTGGSIYSDGGAPISLRGIAWSAVGDPINDPAAIITLDGSGVGNFPSQISNLLRNTTYYVRAYAVNIAGKAYGDLLQFTTSPATTPVLSSPNITITDITDTSAVSEVTIFNNGGEVVTERGMSWSTDRVNIVYGPSFTINPTDIGTFICNITNLVSGTTYYVRAYAKNNLGISYSSESSFITTSLPTLTTIVPHNYDTASHKNGWFLGYNGTLASCGGNITSNGVSLITKRGLCWSTSPNPTTALLTKIEESVSGSGTGIFYGSLTALTPGTIYFVRAYATNSQGTAYGSEMSFKTPELPELTTTPASLITNTKLSSGGNIAKDGRMPILTRGLCWSLANDPSIEGEHSSDGNGIGSFTSNLTKLKGGTQYYIRAYATNAVGTSYGNIDIVTTAPPEKATIKTTGISGTSNSIAIGGGDITSDGGANITSCGVIWSLTPNFVPDLTSPNKTEHTGSLGKFNSTITGLVPNKTYYVLAYAVNSAGVIYGNEINFKTYTIPSLITTEASSVSTTTAISGGDIFSDGGDTVTSSGIVWSTSVNPTLQLSTKTQSGTGIGNFIHSLSGLMGSTTYYVRAYATNKAGTAYGNEISFATAPPILPVIETIEGTQIKESSAICGGRIVSNGGGIISQYGVVWSTSPGFLPDTTTGQKTIQQYDKDNFSSDIIGLNPGMTYYVRAYAVNSVGVAFGNEVVFKTTMVPTLTTLRPIATSISSTSATSGGNITNNGGSFISSNGICWSITNDPKISDNYSIAGSGSGNFTANLTDLMGSTTYYVRAFATNSTGTAYGNLESFVTKPPLPVTVITTNVKDITGDTATSGGDITSNGGALVSSRGIVWSTDPNFDPNTILTNRTADTGYEKGSFVSILKNLIQGTTYYVCAYAVSVAGTSYGDKISFTTPVTATITSNLPGSVTSTTAVLGGMINNSGGSAVLKRGVFWSTVAGFIPDVLSSDRTDDGTSAGSFNSYLKRLIPNTMYYARAYATNVVGTSFGQEVSFITQPPTKPTLTTVFPTGVTGTTVNSGGDITDEGGVTVTARGVIWSSQANFDPAAEMVNKTIQTGNGLGVFSSTITGLNLSTTYYLCAYASNAVGTTYGDKISFMTTEVASTPVLATITSNMAGSVTSTTVAMGGTIINSGGSAVLNRGVLWSTVPSFVPNVSSADRTNDGVGTGSFISNLKNLTPNTIYYVRAYAITIAGISYGEQVSFTTTPPAAPTITTVFPTGITGTTANCGGNISDEGGLTVSTCGVVWSNQPNFDPATVTANKTAQIGNGSGVFSSTISGLNLSTTYYVCAYASNGVGMTYGNVVSFTTPGLASITSSPPASVTNSTAVMGGVISNSGGSAVLKRGVVWSTVSNFVPDALSIDRTNDGNGTGSFVSNLKNLIPNTKYYIRAYAITLIGTSYGEQVSFITYPPTVPTVTTVLPTGITGATAISGGNITDEGGINGGTRGIVWSTQSNFDPAAVIMANKTIQTGDGTGVFNSTLTGLNLGTTYYVRAYAANGVGTSYGNELSFTTLNSPTLTTIDISGNNGISAKSGGVISSNGGAIVTEQGVCWSTSPNPVVGFLTKTDDSGAGIFTSSLINLTPGTIYYVRAYATNVIGTSYGNEINFTTAPILASLTTTDPVITSNTTASSGGNISSDGGAPITARGIVWSSDENFVPDTVLLNRTIDGSGIGNFISELKDLVKSTTYYVRAYATNSVGTVYGDQFTVVIYATSPLLNTNAASSITDRMATGGGQITSDGGAVVTQRGICWSTLENPTIEMTTKTSDVDLGNGSFTSQMSGLLPNTLYYVRAYAINGIGVGYGLKEIFITFAKPTLTATTAATNIKATTATSGGWVTDDGRTPILSRGIVWSTYSNPTFDLDTKTVDVATQGIGSFNADITGLTPNTMYYVRAYATNSAGITYGSEMTFTTKGVMLATLTTNSVTAITEYSVNGEAEVIDDGGMPVTARGFVWNTISSPTIVLPTKIVNGTAGTGLFNNVFSGLIPGSTYYVRAYATNSQGTAYGNEVSVTLLGVVPVLSNVIISNIQITNADGAANLTFNGGKPIIDLGLIWNTADTIPVPTTSNSLSIGNLGTSIFGTVSNLLPATKYYVWALGTNEIGTGYSSLPAIFTSADLASVTTTPATAVLQNTATSGGTISNDGGVPITARGICWSTTPNPTIAMITKTDDGAGAGVFTSSITGLTQGTKYYIRAYATNSMGTAYGIQNSFTTQDIASVTTTDAISITSTSAIGGGEIINDGGATVTSRGVCWSTTPNPTILLTTKTTNSSGAGIFTSNLSLLTLATTYYIRAYATNSVGTAYGNEVTFTTLAEVPALSNVIISNMSAASTDGSATVTLDRGAAVTARGLVWSSVNAIPTLADNIFTDTGSGMGSFTGILEGLVNGTTYHVRAYATNSMGTGFSPSSTTFTTADLAVITTTIPSAISQNTASSGGVISSDGGAAVTSRGVCWSTIPNPTTVLATKTSDGNSTGVFTSSLTNLTQGTKYYVRAYATNSMGTTYGIQQSFTTQDIVSITTTVPTSITAISTTSGGTIVNDGGVAVTSRGVCWGTTPNPTILLPTKTSNGTGIGAFTSNVSSLTAATLYYIRAYATNSIGTTYGDEVTFTTSAVVPTLSNVTTSNMTGTSTAGSATVTSDGGAAVTARGLVWSSITTTPTLNDNVMASGAGTGSFTATLSGLSQGVTTYYVRAYATNSAGTAYSTLVNKFTICLPFTAMHLAGINGVPVDKTVTYNSVSSDITGEAKCWITQNLGSDQQATDFGDGAEASAGWYWQFNRVQAYKHDGTTRSPSTTWIASISENTDWMVTLDPCSLLLGGGWRLPTSSEWLAADAAPQNWAKDADAYASVLKLHNAGYLLDTTGALGTTRGTTGMYWSSSENSTANGRFLSIASNYSGIVGASKASAYPVRCLQGTFVLSKPTLSNVTTSNMTATSTVGSAMVILDGGATVTNRGLVWSSTTTTPTLNDNVVSGGSGMGSFTVTLSGLSQGATTYYVRAYATNSAGTSYSALVKKFTICLPFSSMHFGGINGAPVDKTVTYNSVSSDITGTAKCWITQNLGSDQQATNVNDATEASAGWYWQFNRAQGYKHDGTTRTPATTWISSISENSAWTATNDPCGLLLGGGWRLPTLTEWNTADGTENWVKDVDAYASVLKLHNGGYLDAASGVLGSRGISSGYWSSNELTSTNSNYLAVNNSNSSLISSSKITAYPIRCLRDVLALSKPTLSNVTTSNMTATSSAGSAMVSSDGGTTVTDRGLVWSSTSTTPTLNDNVITSGSGLGSFTATLSGLSQGATIYYVRAYATNSAGTSYSPLVNKFKLCLPLAAIHLKGINGAPVDKTVTYNSVSSDITGTAKCWITQNLGSDRQATDVSDATEASAGWYWQFNRAQGYKHDGTTRTPATTWVTSISENSAWTSISDPCVLLLGGGWRLPTQTEWTSADAAPQNWGKDADAYASVLKLHSAGYLLDTTGALGTTRGSTGRYWSSSENSVANGAFLIMANNISGIAGGPKASSFPVRCLQDTFVISKPTLTNVTTSDMTATSTVASATVTLDGGSVVTDRGLVWSSTNTTPTLTDNVVASGSGMGSFTSMISGLSQGALTYYVRAYATNSAGTAYSAVVRKFTVCLPFTAIHKAGFNGAPIDKTVTYNSVSSDITGMAKCWITQNLGSGQQAADVNDATEASAGWYWQFNRTQGYKHDGTTRTPATTWITNDINDPWSAVNDPCGLLLGGGWRLPTLSEWAMADASPQNWGRDADAYASALKLHDAGFLAAASGMLVSRGTTGAYWSSEQLNTTIGRYMNITSSYSLYNDASKAFAYPVRCLRDAVALSKPMLTNVGTSNITSTSADGSATVTLDGGAIVTERGLVWSSTNNTPTLNDNIVVSGSGIGSFTGMLSGLSEGAGMYYVRAYATNSVGTAYSPLVNKFKICLPFTAIHLAGINGAPEDKTVIYKSVNSDISGEVRCWITQNLGATQEANSVNDVTESSAGWYWQFNRAQGYKHDASTRSPATTWITIILERGDWIAANDPCSQLLGGGWRVPTKTEWTTVDAAPQNWLTNADAYASVLKLHNAGVLAYNTGALGTTRGTIGAYWSSTGSVNVTNYGYGGVLNIGSTNSVVTYDGTIYKASAYSIRCLK